MTTYRDNEAFVLLLERCRAFRRNGTDSERLLWRLLRARQLAGAKFRRQHQFGPYILDFYCHEARLAIEVDGSQHLTQLGQIEDADRTAYLAARGLRVMRFSNSEVLQETEAVARKIWEALADPHPNPLPEGEGIGTR
jgi:very-short-patch-repair endonuclease